MLLLLELGLDVEALPGELQQLAVEVVVDVLLQALDLADDVLLFFLDLLKFKSQLV